MEESCSIYTLIDPRDGTVRYVGQSVAVQWRFMTHCSKSNIGSTGPWIQELKRLKLKPILQIVEVIKSNNASIFNEREAYWIDFYLAEEEPLLNRVSEKRILRALLRRQ